MLYSEFLIGTSAVDYEETYQEYKRVEEIYMESSKMTKEDAYRMAKVETVKEKDTRLRKARKEELKWVNDNLLEAAAYIKAMASKLNQCVGDSYFFRSEAGNDFELRFVRQYNCYSVILYELLANNKPVNPHPEHYDRMLINSAEIQSYNARWHDKTKTELEEMFGYIL